MMKLFIDAIGLAGFGLLICGLWQLSAPVAMIVGGVLLLFAAVSYTFFKLLIKYRRPR